MDVCIMISAWYEHYSYAMCVVCLDLIVCMQLRVVSVFRCLGLGGDAGGEVRHEGVGVLITFVILCNLITYIYNMLYDLYITVATSVLARYYQY